MKIATSPSPGFTLVEIMIVVAIIGLLAAAAIPNLVRARSTAQKHACVSNLKQIEGAKQQWGIEYKKSGADTPSSDEVRFYIKNSQYPSCPTSGSYTIGNLDTAPACSQSASGHIMQ